VRPVTVAALPLQSCVTSHARVQFG
jgi:hypothetical protein